MIKVFVTGASGFVGQRLVSALDTKNNTLRVLSRGNLPGIETVVCDLQSKDMPDDALTYIIDTFTGEEKGVRNLKRCLEIVYSKLNLFRLMKPNSKLFNEQYFICCLFKIILEK